MKLSNETLNVLANFASMNPNLEFKKGKDIKTISSTKAVLAKAVLKDDFPQDFCVHDLNQFLMTYNHSKDTEIKFEDKNIIVEYNPRSKVEFRMSEKSTILVPPDKELSLPSIDVKTTIKEEDFKDFLKISSMLKSPHMAIESDGDTVFLISYDAKDNSAHKQSIKIDDGNGRPAAVATWDYLPSSVQHAMADLKNVLVTGDLAGAKVVQIDRLQVNVTHINDSGINFNVQQFISDLEKLKTEAQLSDVAVTVTKNYNTYYECAVKNDAWIEWYNIQKSIYESTYSK